MNGNLAEPDRVPAPVNPAPRRVGIALRADSVFPLRGKPRTDVFETTDMPTTTAVWFGRLGWDAGVGLEKLQVRVSCAIDCGCGFC